MPLHHNAGRTSDSLTVVAIQGGYWAWVNFILPVTPNGLTKWMAEEVVTEVSAGNHHRRVVWTSAETVCWSVKNYGHDPLALLLSDWPVWLTLVAPSPANRKNDLSPQITRDRDCLYWFCIEWWPLSPRTRSNAGVTAAAAAAKWRSGSSASYGRS